MTKIEDMESQEPEPESMLVKDDFFLEFGCFETMYLANYESAQNLYSDNGTLTPNESDFSTAEREEELHHWGSETGHHQLQLVTVKGEKAKNSSFSSGYLSDYSHNLNSSFLTVADCIRDSFLSEIAQNQDLSNCREYIYSVNFNGKLLLSDEEPDNMQSSSLVKEWSSPPKKTVVGQPPNSSVRPETIRSEERQKDVRVVTPFFKSSAPPGQGSLPRDHDSYKSDSLTRRPNGDADYKVEQSQDHYRLHIIDPKVESHANIPVTSTLPSTYRKRNKTPDFPSAHSKRSFLKLDPLEPRRLRSVEIRPITTTDYLSESLGRHRAMVSSPLKEQLKVNERDVNRPWEKPGRPGPKLQEPIGRESIMFRSTEEIRHKPPPPPQQTSTPKRDQELDELTRLREDLLERSKHRTSDYKLTMQDIQKLEAPQSAPFVKDRVRDFSMFETKSTTSSSTKAPLSNLGSSGGGATESVATWQFSSHSFSPRSVISVNGHKDDGGLLRVRTDLSPPPPRQQTMTRSNAAVQTHTSEQHQMYPYPAVLVPIPNQSPASTNTREYREEHRVRRDLDRYASLPDLQDDLDKQSTLIKIQDERSRKPKSIMKQQQRNWERGLSADGGPRTTTEIIRHGGNALEIIQQTEETTRTEEIERKVREKEKKRSRKGERRHHRESGGHRSHHHHSNSWGAGGHFDDPPWTVPFGQNQQPIWKRPALTTNGYSEGYQPHINEGYTKQTTTRRVHEGGSSSSRHGSTTDSMRRRDVNYMPNGDIRQGSGRRSKGHRVHKSQSSRDVYHNELPEDYFDDPRGPIVEFPPTLPRGQRPAHYNSGSSLARHGQNVHKSRSFADWEEGNRSHGGGQIMNKWDNDMSQLERDFRDTLLMPMPPLGQNVDEREYREEEIPGGHESLRRETTGNSGRKMDPNTGGDTHFSESKQQIHYKKEIGGDTKRR